jgi:hypothetical protein
MVEGHASEDVAREIMGWPSSSGWRSIRPGGTRHLPFELGQLVQEQQPVVGQPRFTGAGTAKRQGPPPMRPASEMEWQCRGLQVPASVQLSSWHE